MNDRFPDPASPDAAVYVISVAAELTGLHPQTLRTYERLGLITPGRTGGGGRRYSHRDIELLREIADLTSSGIGIEGVRRILELENRLAALPPATRSSSSSLRPPGRRCARRPPACGPPGRGSRPSPSSPPPGSRSWCGAATGSRAGRADRSELSGMDSTLAALRQLAPFFPPVPHRRLHP